MGMRHMMNGRLPGCLGGGAHLKKAPTAQP
jgi:hypothetical protein